MYWDPVIEKMPRKELEELQLKKLRYTVEIAYKYSPFYRKLYKEAGVSPDDIKTLDDLTKFPFVVKQDLRNNYMKR